MTTIHAGVMMVLPAWAIDLIDMAYPLCLLCLVTSGTIIQIVNGSLF
jgi:hypothetical protein